MLRLFTLASHVHYPVQILRSPMYIVRPTSKVHIHALLIIWYSAPCLWSQLFDVEVYKTILH